MKLKGYKNTKKQGDAGVGVAIAYFCVEGYNVSLPLTDSQDYDLIVEQSGKLETVQVKTATQKDGNIYVVELQTKGGNQSWSGIVKTLKDTEVDLLFVVTKAGTTYLIPVSEITNRATLNLGNKYEKYRVGKA